ncbi:MAG: ribose-5-phosphate isomerase A, partial [Pseudolabrys sp.]
PPPIELFLFCFVPTPRTRENDIAPPAPATRLELRQGRDGHVFVTDGGHWILDAALGLIADPKALAQKLAAIPGVMEHGLFIGLAQTVVLAGPNGVRVLDRP